MLNPIEHYFNSNGDFNYLNIINYILILIFSVIASILVAQYAEKKWKGNKKIITLVTVGITLLMTALLISFFGLTAITLQGVILTLILITESYSDIKVRECDDWLHVMIVIAGFIGININLIPKMILSAMCIGGIMLFCALILDCNIGGADIKCATACTFLMGFNRGITGLVIGLFLGIVFNIFKSKEKKKKGFPLIPYLTAGYLTAFIV